MTEDVPLALLLIIIGALLYWLGHL